MALSHIDRAAVLRTVEEFDRLGRDVFLKQYGFGRSRSYFLLYEGKTYDSKAIVGVAHSYTGGDRRPLRSTEFSGGEASVAELLRGLGFVVQASRNQLASGSSKKGHSENRNASASGKPIHVDRIMTNIERFYALLSRLTPRRLAESSARTGWPECGIYFFLEDRRASRVGTHRITDKSRASLWQRLRQHRGVTSSGGGNHRGSVFRKLVGMSLIERDGWDAPQWGIGNNAISEIRTAEQALEREVSAIIGNMPVVVLEVPDLSMRKSIEKNAIALLSGQPAPDDWLGHWCPEEPVRTSGLWNREHVDKECDLSFLQEVERLI